MSHTPTLTRRALTRLAAGLLAAGMLAACGGGAEKTGNATKGKATGEAVKIQAGDNFFKPERVKLKSGDEVTVEITNAGNRPHDWTVDQPKLSTGVMSAGEVFNATFTVPEGDVKFVCTLHNGMEGTIQVS